VAVTQQLRNPASAFSVDNNGVIIELPAVAVGGQSSVSSGQGALVFGIGTASSGNNALGSATILTLDTNPSDSSYGGFTTRYNNKSYYGSFIDSGSNAIFFLDQPSSGITDCSSPYASYYCPSSAPLPLSATNLGANGNSLGVNSTISKGSTLISSSNTAFSDLAGPLTSGTPNSTTQANDAFFDWGLSFFYGRNVYTSINGINVYGAFWAYSQATAGGNTVASTASNVAPLYVDSGPVPSVNPQNNILFTTVIVCAPGSTTNCQTIDHVAVDTGSVGLRIPYLVLNSSLASALTNVNTSTPLAECVQFLDNSFFWGSVKYADVKMGGSNNNSEVASSIPIHVLGDPTVESLLPSSCSTVTNLSNQQISGTEEDTVNTMGANGVLGVGNYQYDCDVLPSGNACASYVVPSMYYSCSQ
jgi:hypothetical protein